MPYDFKKELKQLYMPSAEPGIIDVGAANFAAVSGRGDPNDPDGEYARAINILYSIQYTIKMSKKGDAAPPGYFDYVVPPLEGFWWFDNGKKQADKSNYNWISVIRLPDYVDEKVFAWAASEAAKKKKIDTSPARFLPLTEGLCVQCMHSGSFDSEGPTVAKLEKFAADSGLKLDHNDKRHHHEIYLSDFRKTEKDKLKTVIRLPVRE